MVINYTGITAPREEKHSEWQNHMSERRNPQSFGCGFLFLLAIFPILYYTLIYGYGLT